MTRKGIRNYFSLMVMGVALFGSGLLLSRTSLAQSSKTVEGTVGDTMCGTKHKMPDAAKCTAGCVSHGAGYALIVGDKVYKLEGKTDGLDKLAGAKAKVTGTVNDGAMTINVQSVSAS